MALLRKLFLILCIISATFLARSECCDTSFILNTWNHEYAPLYLRYNDTLLYIFTSVYDTIDDLKSVNYRAGVALYKITNDQSKEISGILLRSTGATTLVDCSVISLSRVRTSCLTFRVEIMIDRYCKKTAGVGLKKPTRC